MIQHVAIIMDGNGRWAQTRGLHRIEGHKAGAQSVRNAIEFCRENSIPYLTLYAFSSENWKRSKEEVEGLMELFRIHLLDEREGLLKHGIRLRAIGDLSKLPELTRQSLYQTIEATKSCQDLTLTLAVSYGGRDELVHAARQLATDVLSGKASLDKIDAETFASYLWTDGIPDPDLLIRTSGEMRISNFLLWQLAYSEIVIVPEMWPDFTKEVFARLIEEFSVRERRFGAIPTVESHA